MQESWTRASTFEALFKHGLKPDPALVDMLRGMGVDLGLLAPQYPTRQWRQVLIVTAAHLYPALSPEEGLCLLGHAFLEGYAHTLLGKMLLVPVGVISTEAMVLRTGSYMNVDRPDVTAVTRKTGPYQAEIDVVDPFPLPDYMRGVLEAVHRRVAAPACISVLSCHESGYTMGFDWTPDVTAR